jgi:hypothetical protein
MSKIRLITLCCVMVAGFLLPGTVWFQVKTNAVSTSVQERVEYRGDGESGAQEEKGSDKSDKAGWMQVGNALSAQPSGEDSRKDAKKNSVIATPINPASLSTQNQACLDREESINNKVSLLAERARAYEKTLSAFLDHIVELKDGYNINSSEVEGLLLVSEEVKLTQIEPLLASLANYQGEKKISCDQGLGTVISSLVQVQGITQQLREALTEYRNSIRTVLFSLKDNSQGNEG